MLKIRLQRVGRKHNPSFRIVLTDSKNGPKSGKAIEILGNYDAKKDVKKVDGERVKYWMSKGAQVSDTVHNILVNEKVVVGKKINVLPKKSPIVVEKEVDSGQSADDSKDEKTNSEETINKTLDEEVKDEVIEETTEAPAEEEKKEETPVEEVKEEETPTEEKKVPEEK